MIVYETYKRIGEQVYRRRITDKNREYTRKMTLNAAWKEYRDFANHRLIDGEMVGWGG